MKWTRQLFSRRRVYAELSEEIREHLEEKIEEFVAGGMSRKEAAHTARREFGNVTSIKENSREVWQWPSMKIPLDKKFYLVNNMPRARLWA